ncbi:hypothetical protein EXIGLDRAFT_492265 [Exidia glandulosa HHB12029]|uniref:SCP domain-containing protein n=1 Tax=Exidia glandulosa HHB12029 TaxID=1314781 RepID=A0A165JLF1_EXIGL|nr:hypothetical protein EXIGLDRAFT_492265 [Exidia glandulosa HHB12029]
MRRYSLLLTLLAAICVVLIVHASPTSRSHSRAPPRQPSIPVRRPSTTVKRPTTPVKRPTIPVKVSHPTRPNHSTLPGSSGRIPVHGAHPPSATPTSGAGSRHATGSSRPGSSRVPTGLPPRDAQSGCTLATSCEACAAKGDVRRIKYTLPGQRKSTSENIKCMWQQPDQSTHGVCRTELSSTPETPNLIATRDECAALHERVLTHIRQQTALNTWRNMQNHVFNGEERDVSGRHLASTWLTAFPGDALTVNAETWLAKSIAKGKTLWLDNEAPGHYMGPYSKTDIRNMCYLAIYHSITEHEGSRTPSSQRSGGSNDDRPIGPLNGQHAYSVRSPHGGHNLCITVSSDFSCFPAALRPTTKAPGEKCAEDGRLKD